MDTIRLRDLARASMSVGSLAIIVGVLVMVVGYMRTGDGILIAGAALLIAGVAMFARTPADDTDLPTAKDGDNG